MKGSEGQSGCLSEDGEGRERDSERKRRASVFRPTELSLCLSPFSSVISNCSFFARGSLNKFPFVEDLGC